MNWEGDLSLLFCWYDKSRTRIQRFTVDSDYSHLPEGVILDDYVDCHRDLTDHYFRNILYAAGCRKTTVLGGSPEVVEAPLWITSYSEFISFVKETTH